MSLRKCRVMIRLHMKKTKILNLYLFFFFAKFREQENDTFYRVILPLPFGCNDRISQFKDNEEITNFSHFSLLKNREQMSIYKGGGNNMGSWQKYLPLRGPKLPVPLSPPFQWRRQTLCQPGKTKIVKSVSVSNLAGFLSF